MNKFINRLKDELNDKRGYIKEVTEEINKVVLQEEIDEKKLMKLTQRLQNYTLEIAELQTKIYVLEEVSSKETLI
jgi:t-SNARE complex subunit (syntaxin)